MDTFRDGGKAAADLRKNSPEQNINRYIYDTTHGDITQLPPQGYIILQNLSRKFASIVDTSHIYCGWNDIKKIQKIYDLYILLMDEIKK